MARVFEKLVEKGPMMAADVARNCLAAVDDGALYALPMAQGHWLWRFKRLLPSTFARGTELLSKRAMARTSGAPKR